MRSILAPLLALIAQAGALVVPRHDAAVALSALPASTSLSREITLTASNGSEVTLTIGTGFSILDDFHNPPARLAKRGFATLPLLGDAKEQCKVVATQQEGSGMPRRVDCQALHDILNSYHHLGLFFHNGNFDADRWYYVFGFRTCVFSAKSSDSSLFFSTADVVNLIGRTLSRRAWTIDGRISASSEVNCPIGKGNSPSRPMFWRLYERKAPQAQVANALTPRDVDTTAPLIVETLDMIPKDTSAYVRNSIVHETGADNTTELGAIINNTVSKHFLIHTGGDINGPNCKPTWLSSSWDDVNIPRRADCLSLLDFVAKNKASIEFEERDLNYWAKFAAHGTCGVMFQTTKPRMVINNRDMTRFLDNAVRWENCNTADGGTKAKMGVKCYLKGDDRGEQFDGEFRLFWRDPSLPVGQLERREANELSEFGNIELLNDDSTEPFHKLPEDSIEPVHPLDDSPDMKWTDFDVSTKGGDKDTVHTHGKLLPRSHKLDSRLETFQIPLGPSERSH